MMLTCVGRGGDGQRIRDEILNIMHRHHIKELKGTWMEEWHQVGARVGGSSEPPLLENSKPPKRLKTSAVCAPLNPS